MYVQHIREAYHQKQHIIRNMHTHAARAQQDASNIQAGLPWAGEVKDRRGKARTDLEAIGRCCLPVELAGPLM